MSDTQLKYKLAVFDLDGTLLNTLADLADSVNYTLKTLNCPQRSTKQIREFLGNGVENLLKRALPADRQNLLKSAIAVFSEYYGKHCLDKTKEYPGISAMLKKLNERGVKCGVFSNKSDERVKQLCQRFFGDLITHPRGTFVGEKIKPDPFGVLELVQSGNFSLSETVFVGDSEVDVMTAANAHVDCISVCWGFKSKQFLLEHGATKVVEDAPSLTAAILGE